MALSSSQKDLLSQIQKGKKLKKTSSIKSQETPAAVVKNGVLLKKKPSDKSKDNSPGLSSNVPQKQPDTDKNDFLSNLNEAINKRSSRNSATIMQRTTTTIPRFSNSSYSSTNKSTTNETPRKNSSPRLPSIPTQKLTRIYTTSGYQTTHPKKTSQHVYDVDRLSQIASFKQPPPKPPPLARPPSLSSQPHSSPRLSASRLKDPPPRDPPPPPTSPADVPTPSSKKTDSIMNPKLSPPPSTIKPKHDFKYNSNSLKSINNPNRSPNAYLPLSNITEPPKLSPINSISDCNVVTLGRWTFIEDFPPPRTR